MAARQERVIEETPPSWWTSLTTGTANQGAQPNPNNLGLGSQRTMGTLRDGGAGWPAELSRVGSVIPAAPQEARTGTLHPSGAVGMGAKGFWALWPAVRFLVPLGKGTLHPAQGPQVGRGAGGQISYLVWRAASHGGSGAGMASAGCRETCLG